MEILKVEYRISVQFNFLETRTAMCTTIYITIHKLHHYSMSTLPTMTTINMPHQQSANGGNQVFTFRHAYSQATEKKESSPNYLFPRTQNSKSL